MDNIGYITGLVSNSMFNYPLCRYFFPDKERRRRLLPEVFNVMVKYGFRFGDIFISSDLIEGAAIVGPPGSKKFSNFTAAKCGGLLLPFKFGIPALDRINNYQTYAAKIHEKYAPDYSVHLMLLAVAPSMQGKGYGSILIGKVLSECRRIKASCYLETQSENNAVLYSHFGFNVVYKGLIPETHIMNYAMVFSQYSSNR
ncbi:MAG: GNAT family N-acetyltransferase [Clostridiales bacterium]|nr:GNAT family N-acetyltransferase [Clostridiales bacterium]